MCCCGEVPDAVAVPMRVHVQRRVLTVQESRVRKGGSCDFGRSAAPEGSRGCRGLVEEDSMSIHIREHLRGCGLVGLEGYRETSGGIHEA